MIQGLTSLESQANDMVMIKRFWCKLWPWCLSSISQYSLFLEVIETSVTAIDALATFCSRRMSDELGSALNSVELCDSHLGTQFVSIFVSQNLLQKCKHMPPSVHRECEVWHRSHGNHDRALGLASPIRPAMWEHSTQISFLRQSSQTIALIMEFREFREGTLSQPPFCKAEAEQTAKCLPLNLKGIWSLGFRLHDEFESIDYSSRTLTSRKDTLLRVKQIASWRLQHGVLKC